MVLCEAGVATEVRPVLAVASLAFLLVLPEKVLPLVSHRLRRQLSLELRKSGNFRVGSSVCLRLRPQFQNSSFKPSLLALSVLATQAVETWVPPDLNPFV